MRVVIDTGREVAEIVVRYFREYEEAKAAGEARFAELLAEHGDDGAGNDWLYDIAYEETPTPTAPYVWLDAINDYEQGPELDAFIAFVERSLT